MHYVQDIQIGKAKLNADSPTYFIADIAANHDGDLNRAKDLIYLAKSAGADCAKFQHFEAKSIVSKLGFDTLERLETHQSIWERSVDEVYDAYHTKRAWTHELIQACKDADIEFMTTPYDLNAIEIFSELVNAFKIGSGDITYSSLLKHVASKGKPVILASGASDLTETKMAVELILARNPHLALLQCNTNYTGDLENFRYVNLNVLKTFQSIWPGMITGLSDHTPGHSAVLGAVAFGAKIIEKHFTDDTTRTGPDHKFALNHDSWNNMVNATRELELALGDGIKRIEKNEVETTIVQRRAIRLKQDCEQNTVFSEDLVECLRPCPVNSISPMEMENLLGKRINKSKKAGEQLTWEDLEV